MIFWLPVYIIVLKINYDDDKLDKCCKKANDAKVPVYTESHCSI